MLKIEKYEKMQEYKKEHYYCDICKKEIKGYDRKETITIEYLEEYVNFGTDGGYENGLAWDFCKKCFKKEILPFLKEKISEGREIDIDW